MIQQQSNPIVAPFPFLSKQEAPHHFWLEYDNSKVKARSRNPWTVQEKHCKVTQWGTRYPNGYVTLDNGTCFITLDELEHWLDEKGKFFYQFVSEDEVPS